MPDLSKCERAALIVEMARQRGSNVEDLRDAAHEAAHVFQIKSFTDVWNRELIHDALTKHVRKRAAGILNPIAMLAACEYQARAVEMLVCRELEVDYDLSAYARTMLLESAMLLGALHEDIDEDIARERIIAAAARKDTATIVKRVLALGDR